MRMTSTLALLAALVAACGAPAAKTPPDPSALVTTAAVTRENLPEIVSGFGSIEFDPASQHTLNAEIEARVIDILAVSGDSVDKGQVILRLGPSSTTGLDLVRFRRDATAAQAVLERTQRLRKDGLASDADVEAAAATARDLDLQASSLEARTGSVSMLRSPIAGIVDALLVERGDLGAPGAQMVRVASADAIQARIGLEIEDATRLKAGDAVSLQPLDGSKKAVETVIRSIDTRIDPSTRMAAALVAAPPGNGLLSGEAVKAEMVAEIHQDAITVPRQAVFQDESGAYVFINDKGTARLRHIEAGIQSRDKTEVLSGLETGEAVILEGGAILSDGMKIRTDAAIREAAQ